MTGREAACSVLFITAILVAGAVLAESVPSRSHAVDECGGGPGTLLFFDPGSAALTQRARQVLAWHAANWKETGRPILLTGYTDGRELDRFGGVLDLRRAEAARTALLRDGVPSSAVLLMGGGAELLLPDPDRTGQAHNRRVSIGTVHVENACTTRDRSSDLGWLAAHCVPSVRDTTPAACQEMLDRLRR